MPASNFPQLHRFWTAGLIVALSFGLAACSSPEEKPDAKPKASESSSAEHDPEWDTIAEKALVTEDLKMLSDHKPEYDKPKFMSYDIRPFAPCSESDLPVDLIGYYSAFQVFKGDPELSAQGFAVEGLNAETFLEVRKIWEKKCESYEADGKDASYKFKQTKTIKAPKGVDKDSWFGACYEGTNTADGQVVGECRIEFRSGDNSLSELVTVQSIDENDANAFFLSVVAAEAMTG